MDVNIRGLIATVVNIVWLFVFGTRVAPVRGDLSMVST